MKSNTRTLYLIVILVIAAVAALTFVNYRYAQNNPGGNDFIPRWLGTRLFIFNGWSPYSEDTGTAIQQQIFGRPAADGEDESLFVYPFYATLIFSPFALVSEYALARALWMTFLEICLVLLAITTLRLVRWRVPLWLLAIYLIFSVTWYHGTRAVINGNVVAALTLLIALAFSRIRDNNDMVAGFFLAYITIKPNIVLLLILFVLLWAISHRRWTIIGWFFIALVLLIVVGMFFIPDWVLQNVWAILRYPDYTTTGTLGAAFQTWWPGVGTQFKWGLTIFLALLLIVEWWSAWGKGFNHFLWTACLTLAVSQWIGISTDRGNFILLFLPLVLIFSAIADHWRRSGDWVVLGMMVLLLVGLWALFLNTLQYGNQPQQHAVMFVPLPFFVILGLYWIRWWVLRPTRSVADY